MSWDPSRPFDRETYRAIIGEAFDQRMFGTQHEDKRPWVRGERASPLWWINHEIRVFRDPDIPPIVSQMVCDVIREFVRDLKLPPFEVIDFGAHESALEQVESCVRGDVLHEDDLFDMVVEELWRDPRFGGRQHGDVYITRHPFVDDPISWGHASFRHGVMALALYGDRAHRQNWQFLRRLVRHEATHLFGMWTHCDSFQNVDGFRYTRNCLMHSSVPSDHLCPKCTYVVRSWWEEIANLKVVRRP